MGSVEQIALADSSLESIMVVGLHEQTDTPTCKTRNWPSRNEALKRGAR
jgi:hypothetical protein